MGRLLQAAVLVMATVAVAGAGPTRKVKVESTPPGATVYIDDVENGSACDATPCTIDVPLGSPTLILRLDKYEPEFMQIDVVKGKRLNPISVKLKGAVGTIRIVDAPRGATVKVNDVDKGKVGRGPFEIEVSAEPASVVITVNGKSQTELVDVEGGKDVEITYKGASTAIVADPGDGGGDDEETTGDGEETDDVTDDGEVTEPPETGPRAPYFEAGLAFDVGFRRFSYTDGTMPFNNGGEVLLGPAVEVWPGRLLGVRALRGLSLFARVQFAVTQQNVTRQNMGTVTDVGAQTLWGAIEVSLRHKWTFGSIGVEANGGYVRDQVEFYADNPTSLDMVPSADYRSIRIGARVSYVAALEPYVAAENRVVLEGGELANRADNTETSGYRVAGGLRTKLGPIGARAEFSYGKYSWTFTNTTTTTAAPPGATDTIMYLSFVVGYDY